MVRFAGVILVVALMAACGTNAEEGPTSDASTSTSTAMSSIAQTFDIGGGRDVYLECTGDGSPTVLLEAGDEADSSAWRHVVPALIRETRVCAYDRLGTGRSDPATGCRRLPDLLSDLEAILQAAKIEPPYVLVGASGGGYLAVGYARQYPERAAGIVLVETHAALDTAEAPPQLVAALRCDAASNVERRDYVAVEHAAWDDLAPVGDIPVVVITNDFGTSSQVVDDQQNVARQKGWLRLSAQATQVVVTTGHDVADNEPDIVVEAVQDVLEAG